LDYQEDEAKLSSVLPSDINQDASKGSTGASDSGTNCLLGASDEDSRLFVESITGLVDAAVKLLGADEGLHNWIMSGVLRKTGVIKGFIDSLVLFVDHRLSAVVDELAIRDAACTIAARLRRHVQAHETVSKALNIPNGWGRSQKSRAQSKDNDKGTPTRQEDEIEVGIHITSSLVLWQEWHRSKGFWPASMPDPQDSKFKGEAGAELFRVKCAEGIQSHLRGISRRILQTALP
ncbi:unnamed protein product, partial [Choristocarpus tenellus]